MPTNHINFLLVSELKNNTSFPFIVNYVIFTHMKLELTFKNIEPITLNNATKYRTQGRYVKSYKSDSYKALEAEIDAIMSQIPELLKEFNDFYKLDEHYLACQYRFYYPIFTKKGTISKTSKDASNIVKPIEDCIFKWLDIDDSQVIDLNVTKIHSENIKICTDLQIKSLHSIK